MEIIGGTTVAAAAQIEITVHAGLEVSESAPHFIL